jgi:hypothetical protein
VNRIEQIEQELLECHRILEDCAAATANLSQQVAEEKAKHADAGGGFMGGLLGSKYRAAARRGASAAKASIQRQAVERRGEILAVKQRAQDRVRALKAELKELRTSSKASARPSSAKSASASLDLLKKLKEAHELGILSDEEYELKRVRVVAQVKADIG